MYAPRPPTRTNSTAISSPKWGVGRVAKKRDFYGGGHQLVSTCRRFATVPTASAPTPVILPPGRLRLVTKPSSTGSAPTKKTIGTVEVAALAANAAAVPSTATRTDNCAASCRGCVDGNRCLVTPDRTSRARAFSRGPRAHAPSRARHPPPACP
jgi:hypothetical protein